MKQKALVAAFFLTHGKMHSVLSLLCFIAASLFK